MLMLPVSRGELYTFITTISLQHVGEDTHAFKINFYRIPHTIPFPNIPLCHIYMTYTT